VQKERSMRRNTAGFVFTLALGMLVPPLAADGHPHTLVALRQGLQELGWLEVSTS
jgi:hypothetical protein